MPFIVLIVLAIVIGSYLYFRYKNKFTRGGDINRQGEDMDNVQDRFDDPKDEQ